MEHEDAYGFEDEDQFWIVLDETISKECDNHGSIDDTLRSYLDLIGAARERFLQSDYDLSVCAYKLQQSDLFTTHTDYIRRQFVQCLIEDDEPHVVLIATLFLIADAQLHDGTYELLNDEGAFPRLVDLISSPKRHGHEEIHRSLMELLYEMSRIQKIKTNDLAHVDDAFIKLLFQIIEQVSDDVNDPYHYPTIRVLLVLNEQFMVAAHDPESPQSGIRLTNKVMKVLSAHGSAYKTFGENIILLLNREDETSLQLLTLKLLYLLFTTPPTYEYFYTNDLRVLVDILMRNLLDLPEEATSLRHTYLRVFYPLLEHTQLQFPPHYKRDEIRKLLAVLGGGQITDYIDDQNGTHHWGHFDAVDETTKRLVKRCEGVSWLTDPETEPPTRVESPIDDGASDLSSPTSPSKGKPPALPAPRKLKKRNSSKASMLTIGQYLTPQLEGARKSSLSMMEVAAQKEKPGVITPSRNPTLKNNLRTTIMHKNELPPPPPQARRSGWMRPKMQGQPFEVEVAKAETAASPPEAKLANPNHHHHHHIPHPPSPIHRIKHQSTPPLKEDLERRTSSAEPPPVPSHHKGDHTKRPPPAPKARRWRKNSSSTGVPREPGKFSANLPSIVTTTTSGERLPSDSPFSPFSPQEKTLSPPGPASSNNEKVGVREALGKAQEKAHEEITDTLEHVELEDTQRGERQHLKEPSEDTTKEHAGLENVQEDAEEFNFDDDAETSGSQSQDGMDQSFHDAAQSLSHTTSRASPAPRSQDLDSRLISSATVMPAPRMVLTPPAQEPLRGVPGPQYALERSPFLTDEETESDNENDDNNEDNGTRRNHGHESEQ
ncbi:pre-rRNA processing [Elasticomyces elasticus]|nr:pre-rRNA processing [Elasticomyces elasticus]KAK5042993.1 pre-rRNA processing [Exophiala sideris]